MKTKTTKRSSHSWQSDYPLLRLFVAALKPRRSAASRRSGSRPKKVSRAAAAAARRLRRARTLAAVYAGIVLVVAITAIHGSHAGKDSQNLNDPFSVSQRSGAASPLYYPARLPAGYAIVHQASDAAQKGIITLTIRDISGQTFSLSEQHAPDGYNFATFYNSMGSLQTAKNRYGTVYCGTVDNGKTRLGSLVTTSHTWLLVTAPAAIPADDITFILQHLAPSQ